MYIFVSRFIQGQTMEHPEADKIDFHFQKCFAKIGRAGVNFFIDPVNFFSGCIDSI